MEVTLTSTPAEQQQTDCLVVAIFEGKKLSATARQLDQACKGGISRLLKRGDMEGQSGQSLLVHDLEGITAPRTILIGCGKEKDLSLTAFNAIVRNATQQVVSANCATATYYFNDINVPQRELDWKIRRTTETLLHSLYKFDQLKTGKDKSRPRLRKVALHVADKPALTRGRRAVDEAVAIAHGASLARDLGNLPGNICTPTYLANEAKKLGRDHARLKVSVLDEAQIKKLKMGSFLSVAKGSREPAKLIVMEYRGLGTKDKPHVLVGKGITFDAGGISIKPAAKMDEMKFDMCGAASVIGTMKTIASLQAKINVVAIIPSCENLPDGNANKPGDIVTSMSGQTIEILNTDAEGRLILCDALTYAEKFKPQSVIDVATLTGACVVALGHQAAAVLGNDEKLIGKILEAGTDTGDRAWQMPLWEEYQEQLNSNFADMANIGGPAAGTITAACFLSRYAKNLKWAHLDIAGVAWDSGNNKGATGRPVTLLSQYLLNQCKK
ncbi:MAG: leucyl aminopeptidase [Gammaproteobacteria bacterium]